MSESAPPAPLPLLLPGSRPGRDPQRSLPRGPKRASPQEVAATQRERLLDALVRTVAEKGYAHARVSDICQAAGVTRPVFYELFDGKEDAFVTAHRHGTDLLMTAVGEAFAAGTDWPSSVRAGLATMLAVLASAPAFAVTALVEAEAAGPAGRRERARLLARFHPFFTSAPVAAHPVPAPGGPSGGAGGGEGEELVGCVVGGAYTALHRWVAGGRVRELPELLPTLSYFVLAPFLGTRAAALAAAAPAPVTALPARCATPERP